MALRSTAVQPQPQGRTVTLDSVLARKAAAEFLGTALLVFFGAGVATLVFGFGTTGTIIAAGMLTTGLAFGLVLLALVALIGPISGCHVNPAVTLAAFLTRRIPIVDAVVYWVSQLIGGIGGALLLLWVLHASPFYTRHRVGLGANGYGTLSLLHISGAGAFLAEIILTAVFVLVVLSATSKDASAPVAGVVIGLALGLVNIMGIPIDGASVNPARSLGPAVVVGGQALSQVWLFLIAPMVGAVLAAGVHLLFHPLHDGEGGVLSRPSAARPAVRPAADEGPRPAGTTATTTGTASATPSRPAPPPATGTGPPAGPSQPTDPPNSDPPKSGPPNSDPPKTGPPNSDPPKTGPPRG